MPPAVIAGGMAAGQLGTSIYGAAEASSEAKKARRQSQEFLDAAMRQQPGAIQYGQGDTNMILQRLLAGGMGNNAPSFFGRDVENQLIRQTTADVGQFSNKLQAQLAEQQASRGLRRSGIGAQQSAQAGADLAGELGKNITDIRSRFQQARFGEYQNNQNYQMQNLLAALGQANAGQQQQYQIYNSMLGLAGGAGQGAAQANQAAGAAFGGVGSALGNAGNTALLYSMLGR